MKELRPQQGNLRLVFRLFKSYAWQASHKTKNLKTSLRFPCLGLNPIIDSISLCSSSAEASEDCVSDSTSFINVRDYNFYSRPSVA